MFPSMRHPTRYVWDFWYYFEPETRLFHVFYLNADEILVPAQQHPHGACLGHGITADFIRMDWGHDQRFQVLSATPDHWANTSIWSGDIIRINNGFLLFFTSRHASQDDGMTQNIGMAYAPSLTADRWQLSPLRLQPDHGYQRRHTPGDLTTHAWRDPFLFQADGQIYMLLSAKAIDDPLGRNGVVGLLRLQDNDFSQGIWDCVDPVARPRCYSEMEVPQLFQDSQGQYELVFSLWAKNDFATSTRQAGGLQGLTSDRWQRFKGQPHVLMPEQSGLYACRIIPELEGEIVGFDIEQGGIRRSGVKTHFRPVNRDFSSFSFQGLG
jgi:hypothetical protein